MKRKGSPIEQAGIKNAVDPGITFSAHFQEWQAGTAAGLSMWQWETGEYPTWFKAKVMAWYELHNLVELHKRDAAMPKKRGRR